MPTKFIDFVAVTLMFLLFYTSFLKSLMILVMKVKVAKLK